MRVPRASYIFYARPVRARCLVCCASAAGLFVAFWRLFAPRLPVTRRGHRLPTATKKRGITLREPLFLRIDLLPVT